MCLNLHLSSCSEEEKAGSRYGGRARACLRDGCASLAFYVLFILSAAGGRLNQQSGVQSETVPPHLHPPPSFRLQALHLFLLKSLL